MNYLRTLPSLMSDYLQDIENQLPDVDRGVGSSVHLRGAALMSGIWGIRYRLRHVAKQIFPDTAETDNLVRHAGRRGIIRQEGESDAELLVRLLGVLRNPPAGGNRYDWPRWCTEAEEVTHTAYTERCRAAWSRENPRGEGTIDLAIVSDRDEDPDSYDAWATATVYAAGDVVRDDSVTGEYRAYVALSSGTSTGTGVANDGGVSWADCEEQVSAELVTSVETYLASKRPQGVWDFEVYGVTKKVQNVTVEVTGDAADLAVVKARIDAHMKSLSGGKGLYVAQIVSLAIDADAENATVSTPSADVPVTWGPNTYERIWPGLITVTRAA